MDARAMTSISSLSAEKLVRLIGAPRCPVLIDVWTAEIFAADPWLMPR
jgi:hypothetical protein